MKTKLVLLAVLLVASGAIMLAQINTGGSGSGGAGTNTFGVRTQNVTVGSQALIGFWAGPGTTIHGTNDTTGSKVDLLISLTGSGGDFSNVRNAFTNPAAGIVGMVQHSNSANANVKGLVAGSGAALTDNGTNVSIALSGGAAPGGGDMAIQFNQGGSTLAGTNTLTFDRTNNQVVVASGTVVIGGSGVSNEFNLSGIAMRRASGSTTFTVSSNNTTLVTVQSGIIVPSATVPMSLGKLADGNGFSAIIVTNVTIPTAAAGSGKVLTSDANGVGTWQSTGAASTNLTAAAIGQVTSSNGTYEVPQTWTKVGTNAVATNSGRYVLSIPSPNVTNVVGYVGAGVTRLELLASPGSTVVLCVESNLVQFPASWYIGGFAVGIATNGLTLVDIWTNSLGTNVWVRGPEFATEPGVGIAYDTNFVASRVTNRFSGNANQFSGNAIKDAAIVTNLQTRGFTNLLGSKLVGDVDAQAGLRGSGISALYLFDGLGSTFIQSNGTFQSYSKNILHGNVDATNSVPGLPGAFRLMTGNNTGGNNGGSYAFTTRTNATASNDVINLQFEMRSNDLSAGQVFKFHSVTAGGAQGAVGIVTNGNDLRLGVYRTIFVGAAAMISNTAGSGTITGAALETTETSSPTNRMVDNWVFSGSTTQAVQFSLAMPLEWDLSTIKVKLFTWGTNNIATVTNVWQVSATAIKDGTVVTNADWGTGLTITNGVGSAAGAAQLTAATPSLTVGNTPAAAGQLVWFRILRLPGHAEDNNGGRHGVLGAWIQYKESTTEPASW